MKWVLSLLLLLSPVQIATATPAPFTPLLPYINPVFTPYIEDFKKESLGLVEDSDFSKASIEFAELGYSRSRFAPGPSASAVIGLCHYRGSRGNLIEIDKTYWTESSDVERWSLMFHELGHCICYRPHPPTDNLWAVNLLDFLGVNHVRGMGPTMPDGCPQTLMNPTVVSDLCIQRHKAAYVKEIFQGCMTFSRWLVLKHEAPAECRANSPRSRN